MNAALIESLLPLVGVTSRRLAPELRADDREEMEAAMRLELCLRMEQYDAARGAAQTYAIGALRNAARQWIGHESAHRRRTEPLDPRHNQVPGAHDPAEAVLAADAQRRALAGVEGLPPRQQVALRMRLWDEATVREMGRRMGVSKSTAARLYNHSIRQLSDTVQ